MSLMNELEELQREADFRTEQKHSRTLNTLGALRDMLNQAIVAINEQERLIAEREFWHDKYVTELNHSIKQSEGVMGGFLGALLKGDIVVSKNNTGTSE